MNSVEKGKIEKIITAEVEERIRELKTKREKAFDSLREEHEKTPPKEVLVIEDWIKDKVKEREELEDELKELGYSYSGYGGLSLCSQWDSEDGESYQKYGAPALTEHSRATALKVRALKRLSRLYQLKLYAGNEEEQEEVLKFVNDFDLAIKEELNKF